MTDRLVTASALGRAAYEGYLIACDGRSLVSGELLPTWDDQDDAIQTAWERAAVAAVRAYRNHRWLSENRW